MPKNGRTGTPKHFAYRDLVEVRSGVFSKDHFDPVVPDQPEDLWILRTRKEEGRYAIDVQHNAEKITLPHEVVVKALQHIARIVKLEGEDLTAERSARGRIQMRDRMDNGEVPGFLRAVDGGSLRDLSEEEAGA